MMRVRRARRRKGGNDGAAIFALIILVIFFIHCVAIASIWVIGSVISIARGKQNDIVAPRWPLPALPPPQLVPERPAGTYQVGKQFEEECAQLLRRCGWSLRHVGGSGDKGADLIGRRPGAVLVVQCKCYGQAVGTRAVQEAHTAGAYHCAHLTAVVAKNGFTAAAKQIAGKVGVRLIDVSELAGL